MVMRYENINGANLINPKYKLIIAVVWPGKTTLHIVQVHINSLLISKLCTIAKYLAGQWQIHRITHFQCWHWFLIIMYLMLSINEWNRWLTFAGPMRSIGNGKKIVSIMIMRWSTTYKLSRHPLWRTWWDIKSSDHLPGFSLKSLRVPSFHRDYVLAVGLDGDHH